MDLFCEECKMLKSSCICGGSKKSTVSKSINKTFSNHGKIQSKGKKQKSKNIIKNISKNSNENNSQNHLDQLKMKYPNIDSKIIENFPFEVPRKDQFEVISEISDAINNGFKYIVLEAGTGTGKSVIAATLAKIYSPTFILTMTKQLQEQYLEDFEKEGFTLVKGRNNFLCKEKELYSDDDGINCSNGTCKERYAFKCNFKYITIDSERSTHLEQAFRDRYWKSDIHCNFLEQKVNGINSDVTIANYNYAMLELNYVGDFIKRNLLILDEAHYLEKKIMNFIELEIDRERLESEVKIKVKDDEIENLLKNGHSAWISFIESVIKRYLKEYRKSEAKLKTAKESKKLAYERILNDLKEEIDNYERFLEYVEDDSGNWILEYNDEFIQFKPLKIDKYAKEYLFNHGKISLLMSATILDYKNFVKWLGLKDKDVKFIHIDTPFKANKRPIDISRSIDMNYEKLKRNAPKTIDFVKEILKKHKNEKGLIHSVSYQCSNFLMNNINDSRLISHTSSNRMKVLKRFEKSKKPLVLLSPSMNEGVDLPYDKCRFQIIYKIPFPNIKDKQIEARKKKDRQWYPYLTMMNLVQTYGRGMRAEDDYCQTYVIDNRLKFYVYESPLYRKFVPTFFKEAIVGLNDK